MNATEPVNAGDVSRRDVIKTLFALAATFCATGCKTDHTALRDFFAKHFKEMSPEELAAAVARWEKRYSEQYHKPVSVATTPAQEGVLFGYALDVSRCIGCRKCVYACVEENNQSRDPQVQWIKVFSMDKAGGVDFAKADPYYAPKEVPEDGRFYVPVQCQQCRNPPCTKVCPTGATWTEADGIVVIDYDWCIGCRYCMAACPYGARHFNWSEPSIPKAQLNPNTHVLGNRPRPKGVVEKCTFCIQRTRKGRYPACVEVCPVGARKFGNLLDPDSEIRYIIEHKRVMVLKEELNTMPKFFYFYAT
jgi:Fe-S-cluster-containing dehydrogenase component